MNFNPQTHLDATTRTVSPHEREGKPASDVTLSRIFDTSIDDLWDAITQAVDIFEPEECRSYFTAAGYEPE